MFTCLKRNSLFFICAFTLLANNQLYAAKKEKDEMKQSESLPDAVWKHALQFLLGDETSKDLCAGIIVSHKLGLQHVCRSWRGYMKILLQEKRLIRALLDRGYAITYIPAQETILHKLIINRVPPRFLSAVLDENNFQERVERDANNIVVKVISPQAQRDALNKNTDKYDRTALFIAAADGNTEAVKALLSPYAHGSKTAQALIAVQQKKYDGLTALHVAAANGRVTAVCAMIKFYRQDIEAGLALIDLKKDKISYEGQNLLWHYSMDLTLHRL